MEFHTPTRRQALTAIGAAAATSIAGCTGGTPDPATVDYSITASDGEDEQELIDETRTIDGGDFWGREFTLERELEVYSPTEILIHSGRIDLFHR